MTLIVVLVVLAYLLGSVPSGYLLGKSAGVDVRKFGSGNIGATNVARAIGKRKGMVTLIADATKGFVPVMIGVKLDLAPAGLAFIAAAAFIGHIYPVFLKFHGGKGVATALGTLLALAPLAVFALLALFATVFLTSRIVSLSAMVAALAAPLILWLFYQPPAIVALGFFYAAVIMLRHQDNIARLRAGTEPRFGEH
jgi:acyl phosphate:glycerol-3-phosphate acyltransferase